ncbi:DUF6407 family protein [Aquibacillus koreensis]|uniref:DUF6407 family protein n=1 Tax=Aquibacillus koreensis TaxID=279446 RepID=A0A9X3WKA0_9BACI|nr:DUF6407 family protein [Aquibacillus koreensis]MCT2536327.1 DUF6407 family protein [Aquibacillus koreensis]MDC3421322.1 DUF6407 family protein [Aquibacillus koreensis]
MNFQDFVTKEITKISDFDHNKLDSIRELVRKAIEYYELDSFEEVEKTESTNRRYLHIYSMMEENVLSKIVKLALDHNGEHDIESVYEGYIIRDY